MPFAVCSKRHALTLRTLYYRELKRKGNLSTDDGDARDDA